MLADGAGGNAVFQTNADGVGAGLGVGVGVPVGVPQVVHELPPPQPLGDNQRAITKRGNINRRIFISLISRSRSISL